MIDLNRLIQQANELAPLPATTVRLAEMVSNPDCDLNDVAELVAFDQALTVKLLRAANSVASASALPLCNAKDAVTRMGTAQVLALAVAAGARPFLLARIPAYGLSEGALWRHSVAAAVSAETAPGFCRVEVPPETFTAALLHDVGKLVMGRFLSPEILDFIHRAREIDHLDQLEAESLLLQVNHAELGGLIAQHWKLPPRVILGIAHHHEPGPDLDVICDLTCLADQVARRIEANLDGRQLEIVLPSEVADRLGITPSIFAQLGTLAMARYAKVSRRYSAV